MNKGQKLRLPVLRLVRRHLHAKEAAAAIEEVLHKQAPEGRSWCSWIHATDGTTLQRAGRKLGVWNG